MYINRFHAFCILPSPSNAAHWWSTESFCKIRNKSQIAENAQQFHCNRTPCSRCSWLTGSFVKRYDFSYLRVGGFKAPEKYANMLWDHEDGKSVRPPLTRLTFASNSALIRLQCLRANPNLSSDNLHPHLSSWGFNKVNDQASKMGHNDLVFFHQNHKNSPGNSHFGKIRVPKIISGWSWLIIMSNSHCHWRITNENWPTIPASRIKIIVFRIKLLLLCGYPYILFLDHVPAHMLQLSHEKYTDTTPWNIGKENLWKEW